MVIELGVKPDKILMLHMDSFVRRHISTLEYVKNFSAVKDVRIDVHLELLKKGVNIGFDSWDGLAATLPDNSDRLKALVELLRKGYGDKITLGHDVYDKSRGVSYGYTGFTGFIQNAIPTLKELGFEDDIVKMTVLNPARILEY